MNIRKLIKETVDVHIGQQDYTNRLLLESTAMLGIHVSYFGK